jgi:hypothetical protein
MGRRILNVQDHSARVLTNGSDNLPLPVTRWQPYCDPGSTDVRRMTTFPARTRTIHRQSGSCHASFCAKGGSPNRTVKSCLREI